MANRNRNNTLVVPGVDQFLNKLKLEIATELGYPDYDTTDKGNLPARIHGAIGGTITKRLIELGQQALANNGQADITHSSLNVQEYKNDMINDMSNGNNSSARQSGSVQ